MNESRLTQTLFKEIHFIWSGVLTIVSKDPLKLNNSINTFFNDPEHYFTLFLTIKHFVNVYYVRFISSNVIKTKNCTHFF